MICNTVTMYSQSYGHVPAQRVWRGKGLLETADRTWGSLARPVSKTGALVPMTAPGFSCMMFWSGM